MKRTTSTDNDVAQPNKKARTEGNCVMTETNMTELNKNGYTVVRQVLDKDEVVTVLRMMNEWIKSSTGADFANMKTFRNKVEALPSHYGPHGVFKNFAGQTTFGWYLRMHPQILRMWTRIWNCDVKDLQVSLDGFCILPSNYNPKMSPTTGEQVPWDHCDAGKMIKGPVSIQSFVALDDVHKGHSTFMCRPGSHNHHAEFVEKFKIDKKNWQLLKTPEMVKFYESKGCMLKPIEDIMAGDVVVWDSRLIHCNKGFDVRHRHTEPVLLRRCVYLSFSNRRCVTEEDALVRNIAFNDVFATTSHWTGNDSFGINKPVHLWSKEAKAPNKPALHTLINPALAAIHMQPAVHQLYRSLSIGEPYNSDTLPTEAEVKQSIVDVSSNTSALAGNSNNNQ